MPNLTAASRGECPQPTRAAIRLSPGVQPEQRQFLHDLWRVSGLWIGDEQQGTRGLYLPIAACARTNIGIRRLGRRNAIALVEAWPCSTVSMRSRSARWLSGSSALTYPFARQSPSSKRAAARLLAARIRPPASTTIAPTRKLSSVC